MDTVGLLSRWHCSTLFLAAVAEFGWSVAVFRLLGTGAVELGLSCSNSNGVGNSRNSINIEVKSDQGLVARIAAWVLAHRLEHTEQCSFARPEKVTFQSSRSILLQGFERSWAA